MAVPARPRGEWGPVRQRRVRLSRLERTPWHRWLIRAGRPHRYGTCGPGLAGPSKTATSGTSRGMQGRSMCRHQKSKGTSSPLFSIRTTGCDSHVSGSPPIPGESSGIPGSANPTASGRSSRSRRMAPAGTCPSITYPSTSAVWHDAAPSGTPCSVLNPASCGSSEISTLAPRSCRYPTHSPQHPQPGS